MPENKRKIPKQKRSKATVDAILEATAQLLLTAGISGLTTNKVAEKAGVSIGSLYQYFPNKNSLIAALIENHVDLEVRVLSEVLMRYQHDDDITLIRAIVRTLLQVHEDDFPLSKILHEQVSHVECREALRKATRLFEEWGFHLLKNRHPHQPEAQLKAQAFVLVNTLDAVVQNALIEQTEMLGEPYLEDELVRILTFCLKPASPPVKEQPKAAQLEI